MLLKFGLDKTGMTSVVVTSRRLNCATVSEVSSVVYELLLSHKNAARSIALVGN